MPRTPRSLFARTLRSVAPAVAGCRPGCAAGERLGAACLACAIRGAAGGVGVARLTGARGAVASGPPRVAAGAPAQGGAAGKPGSGGVLPYSAVAPTLTNG